MAPNVTTIVLVGAAGAAAIYLFILRQRRLAMLPTDEEQKWLDEQIITPRPPCMSPGSLVSEEEQKWLDKQIQNVETEEVRLCPAAASPKKPLQSGCIHSHVRFWFASIARAQMLDDARQAAYAPGEGSSPKKPPSKKGQ